MYVCMYVMILYVCTRTHTRERTVMKIVTLLYNTVKINNTKYNTVSNYSSKIIP